ncbi:mCG1050976 [Mus musculus]|nr:mCG1050976 [Mus musculus]
MIMTPSDTRVILYCASILYDVHTMTKLWTYFSNQIPVIKGHACIFFSSISFEIFSICWPDWVQTLGLK